MIHADPCLLHLLGYRHLRINFILTPLPHTHAPGRIVERGSVLTHLMRTASLPTAVTNIPTYEFHFGTPLKDFCVPRKSALLFYVSCSRARKAGLLCSFNSKRISYKAKQKNKRPAPHCSSRENKRGSVLCVRVIANQELMPSSTCESNLPLSLSFTPLYPYRPWTPPVPSTLATSHPTSSSRPWAPLKERGADSPLSFLLHHPTPAVHNLAKPHAKPHITDSTKH